MRFTRVLPLALLALSACAFQTKVQRAPGAPKLEPSASAQVVAEPPQGAVALGRVTIQGNNWQNGGGCESQAQFEAKKLGATHVVIRPANSSMGRGVRCTADAFYVAPASSQSK
jgi:Zn-dependent alcohol dehydrogenase